MKFKPAKKIVNKEGQETFAHLHDGKRPLSRRDFLATGLIPFAASIAAPPLLHLLARSGVAEAQELVCPEGGTPGLVPIITLNLSGGAALASNWVPMDADLQPLPSYEKMGLGKGSTLPLEYVMGGAPFAAGGISQILEGIKTTGANAMLKTAFVGVPVRSQDDSDVNKFDITGLISKAGYQGGFLPNLGRRNSATGTNNSFAYVQPPTPLPVGNKKDIESAIGVAGSLNALSQDQKSHLFKMIRGLNSRQSRGLASLSGGNELSRLVQCAGASNHKLISTSDPGIDPLSNPDIATIWGIDQDTNPRSQDMVFASMVYNGLLGNAGTVNLEMGGYDYHNGTRTSGDQKDLAAGMVIGRILESANVLGKKVFLVVTSDGSVSSPPSTSVTSPWTSDRGSAGSAYMMAFNPTSIPQTSGFQLGHFNKGQGADGNFLTGGSAELAAAAIFANYLSFSGKINMFESVLPRVFSVGQLNQVLKIF